MASLPACLLLLLLAACGAPTPSASNRPSPQAETTDIVSFETAEATRLAFDLSPDGRTWRALIVAVAAAAGCRPEPAPARLTARASDTVLINNRNPIRIPLRVLDAEGQPLADNGVRFERIGGDDLPVTAEGAVSCA